jgi:general secretion pathway protein G
MLYNLNSDESGVTKFSILFRQLTGRRCSGFTLVELLMVVALVGILATLAIPSFSSYTKKAKNGACTTDIRNIDRAITSYILDKNALPVLLSDIGIMGTQSDPWKHLYEYQVVVIGSVELLDIASQPFNTDYDLYSKGADGASVLAAGGAGNEDDIVRSNNGVFVGMRD